MGSTKILSVASIPIQEGYTYLKIHEEDIWKIKIIAYAMFRLFRLFCSDFDMLQDLTQCVLVASSSPWLELRLNQFMFGYIAKLCICFVLSTSSLSCNHFGHKNNQIGDGRIKLSIHIKMLLSSSPFWLLSFIILRRLCELRIVQFTRRPICNFGFLVESNLASISEEVSSWLCGKDEYITFNISLLQAATMHLETHAALNQILGSVVRRLH